VQIDDAERAWVSGNDLSFNGRAGGFFWTSGEVTVRGNRVVGNGASGLFFHKPSVTHYRVADVRDNPLEGNRHAGIGVSMTAVGDFAQNTFRFNASLPIDVGLDGDTPATLGGYPGQGGRAGAPTIVAARWDGTATSVEIRLAEPAATVSAGTVLYLFANDEPFLSVTPTRMTSTVRVEKDLRGFALRAAEATIYIYVWDYIARGTSELSAPVVVE
jgi:hypothetical protein